MPGSPCKLLTTPVKKRIASCEDGSVEKRRRLIQAQVIQQLQRPSKPVGEPWPLHDLRAFDAPTEGHIDINFGPMLPDVLKARGWKYSRNPCHGVFHPPSEISTYWVKEFEASVRGEDPEEIFDEEDMQLEGHRLQALTMPKHALWMMGRLPYRVPGKKPQRDREDFIRIVIDHGENLPGKPGNHRMAKFPGTERMLWKTHLTEAFRDKAWYPKTFLLPAEKSGLVREMAARGNSQNNLWIGKPRNDFGGKGIRVWKGTDPDLIKQAKECDSGSPPSLIQHYIPDPHLVGGYKYHMRIHLLITNVSPVQAYVQENGQCLFATKPYTLSNKTLGASFDPPVHVTNLGLNTKPDNKENFFRKKPVIGRGQQLRMRQLVAHLTENVPGFNKQDLWQQINTICADTATYLAQGVRKNFKTVPDRHFEVFGMDLMLDTDMKVWMCEVNTDPGLAYPDKEVLGSPNPDYQKESKACEETFHDIFTLLGLDAGREQTQGSLRHWFKLDFPEAEA